MNIEQTFKAMLDAVEMVLISKDGEVVSFYVSVYGKLQKEYEELCKSGEQ